MTGEHAAGWFTDEAPPDLDGPQHHPYVPLPAQLGDAPLSVAIADAVHRWPDREAARAGPDVWSFARLAQAATRLTADLAAGPPGPLAILLPPGPRYMAALWGALAAGRPAIVLDDLGPAQRTDGLMAASGARVAVVSAGAEPRHHPTVIVSDGRDATAFTPRPAPVDAPAWGVPTSGSTGVPKVVAHSQRAMAHWIGTAHRALHVGPDDRVLTLSPPSALSALSAHLGMPLAGAATEFVDPRRDGFSGILAALHRGVTLLRGTPSLLRALAALPEARGALGNVRAVQSHGEALTRRDLALLRSVLPAGCHVRVTYGATEASGAAWFCAAGQGGGDDALRLPAGRLLPGAAARIIDRHGADVDPGTVGELVIRSRHAALGEFRDGGLTPGRLAPDPGDPASRIYRTGDLARRVDGLLTILGREDRMVKVNGLRTDPLELEAALKAHPAVSAAGAAAESDGGRLVAFVVLAQEVSGRDLIHWTRARVPAHMVPRAVHPVGALPIMPNGKLDLQTLGRLAARAPAANACP